MSIPATQGLLLYIALSFFMVRPLTRLGVRSHTFDRSLSMLIHVQIPVIRRGRLLIPWWKYLLLALADVSHKATAVLAVGRRSSVCHCRLIAGCSQVEGYYFVMKAYDYSTIASVQLLYCFAIPVCMVLSRLVMNNNFALNL